jgi:hypothetical protein
MRSVHDQFTMERAWRRVVIVSFGLLWAVVTCAPRTQSTILLFNGDGSSPGDVAALARILKENGFSYSTANSRELER